MNQHETHERHLQVQVQQSYDLCITTTQRNAMLCCDVLLSRNGSL